MKTVTSVPIEKKVKQKSNTGIPTLPYAKASLPVNQPYLEVPKIQNKY